MKAKSSASKVKKPTYAQLKAKVKQLEDTILLHDCRHDHDSLRIAFEAKKELASLKPLVKKQTASPPC